MNLLNVLTPININEEKVKFFKSKTYNPVFDYLWNKNKDICKNYFEESKYSNLVEAILNQNNSQIINAASKVFDTRLEEELLKYSKSILESKPVLPTKATWVEIKSQFENAFKQLDLKYNVKLIDEHGFFFRPKYADKLIHVSKYAELTYFSVDGEVRHELLHIIRFENGAHNNIEKSNEYLPTEEGLATYFQDYTGKFGEASLFQHAAEYAVTEVGVKFSFREMFNYLVDIGFNEELAWQRAIRHKFGFIDTSKPGDIMKPSMYFYHQQKIKSLSDDEKLRLLVGKISLADLNNFPEYRGKISKEKLVDFYKLNI